MKFWQLLDFVKKDGCKVIMYDKEELKIAQCAGTFDISKMGNPLICLAIKGHTQKELTRLLLHEYAHFLQWRTGFLHKLEGADLKEGWDVFDRWFRHVGKYTRVQLERSRNAICLIEYDAEIRVLELASKYNIDIGSYDEYMTNAYSYVSLIKWSFKNRSWGYHPGEGFDGYIRTPEEILSPITKLEEDIINKSQ